MRRQPQPGSPSCPPQLPTSGDEEATLQQLPTAGGCAYNSTVEVEHTGGTTPENSGRALHRHELEGWLQVGLALQKTSFLYCKEPAGPK